MKKLYITFLMLIILFIVFSIFASAQFVKVISESTNIVEMPNTESRIIGETFKGEVFNYISEKNGWIEIDMFSGDSRYINSNSVKVSSLGVSVPLSDDTCQMFMTRLETAEKRSLNESDVASQNFHYDKYVLEIFHELGLQPVIYQIAVSRCKEGPGSKIGLRPTVKIHKEPVKNNSSWYEIARWQGKSIKNTETFHIPTNEWRISWKTEPGEYGDMNFQIYVYDTANNFPQVAANVIGYDMDSSIMRGVGDYYLTINSAQHYVIVVEAKY